MLLHLFKITFADVRLTCHHQPASIRNLLGDTGDGRRIVGDILAYIPAAAGGGTHQFASFILQLHGQAVVFVHEHHRTASDKG